jgi:TRAP-type C4-dicarboxylate transport system permease small subunit
VKKALDCLKNLDGTVGYLLLFVIMVVVFLQIMSRILPGNAISWTLEVSEMLLGALIWLNISVGIISGAHVSFDLIVRRLPHKMQKFMVLLNNAIFIAYLVLLAAFTVQVLNYYLILGSKSTILQISMFWVRMPILIGCIVTIIRLCIKEYRIFTDRETKYFAEYGSSEGGV